MKKILQCITCVNLVRQVGKEGRGGLVLYTSDCHNEGQLSLLISNEYRFNKSNVV